MPIAQQQKSIEPSLRQEIRRLRGEVRRLKRRLKETATPVAPLLRRRGFALHQGKRRLEEEAVRRFTEAHADALYPRMARYSFRLIFRDVIRCQRGFGLSDLTRFCAPRVAESHLRFLIGLGAVGERPDGRRGKGGGAKRYRLLLHPVRSFGGLLEWFLAEALRREFAVSALWGVKVRGLPHGGDLDVVANLEGRLVYLEAKSSPPKQIDLPQVQAFLQRLRDLRPDLALFVIDTELRMRDKIIPLMEEGLRSLGQEGTLQRLEGEVFHRAHRLYVVGSKGSLLGNLNRVFQDDLQQTGGVL
ncbi:MAG: hypothetical protein HZA23_08160 [Nitrospirae bacterium]|nr:hypothetical protein [Nitrospirota bacterium]